MTENFEKIIKELEKFCRDRKIQIAVSGYDGIYIYDLDDGPVIWCDGIEDKRISKNENIK